MSGRVAPAALVAVLFVGPLVLAALLYFGPFDVSRLGTLANPDRELIAGAIALPVGPLAAPDGAATQADWARYRWSLIYARMRPCEAQCLEHLTRLTQVHLALGRERERVQRVLLVSGDLPDLAHDESLLVGLLDSGAGATVARLLGLDRIDQGRFFVVDPLGLVVVSYPPDADQARLLEDLERLLDVSRVG